MITERKKARAFLYVCKINIFLRSQLFLYYSFILYFLYCNFCIIILYYTFYIVIFVLCFCNFLLYSFFAFDLDPAAPPEHPQRCLIRTRDRIKKYCVQNMSHHWATTSSMRHHISNETQHLQSAITSSMCHHVSNEQSHIEWAIT